MRIDDPAVARPTASRTEPGGLPSYASALGVAIAVTLFYSLASFAAGFAEDDTRWLARWEHQAADAELAGDAAFFMRGLHADWSGALDNGAFQTRRQRVADVRDAPKGLPLRSTLRDLDVRIDGDVAIATYGKHLEGNVDGKGVLVDLMATDTFVRRDGRWLQLASHVSKVAPPEE